MTQFPRGFFWGSATSSYQIEGAAFEDGRGLSIWDMMCRKPGKVYEGHTGALACDHYHRFRDDVGLMKQIGLQAYRFSIAWPRVLPHGTGEVNPVGLDFYDRLVDELLAAGITPWATLYHWDLPLELYYRGGWLNQFSPEWFAEYTELMGKRLGDRVKHWMTLNEPACTISLGLESGVHAPGDQLAFPETVRAAFYLMKAHGRAVQALRATVPEAKIGLAQVSASFFPASNSPQDIEAARQMTFSAADGSFWQNAFWLEPMLLGHFPQDWLENHARTLEGLNMEDLKIIQQPLDFLGINIYHSRMVQAGPNGPQVVEFMPGCPRTMFKWPVTPESLYWNPRFIWERYGLPIVITENGLSNQDWVSMDGKVHDPQRIDSTRRYLIQLRRAAREGVNLLGYFHWSLMDNFEWGEGYSQRFGMVYVDFQTQERIPKDSARWYSKVIATHGAHLDRQV